jgi:DnaJ-class molecular chaperone
LITEAYRVLSDAKLRKLYDEGGAEKVAVYETSPKYKEYFLRKYFKIFFIKK